MGGRCSSDTFTYYIQSINHEILATGMNKVQLWLLAP